MQGRTARCWQWEDGGAETLDLTSEGCKAEQVVGRFGAFGGIGTSGRGVWGQHLAGALRVSKFTKHQSSQMNTVHFLDTSAATCPPPAMRTASASHNAGCSPRWLSQPPSMLHPGCAKARVDQLCTLGKGVLSRDAGRTIVF